MSITKITELSPAIAAIFIIGLNQNIPSPILLTPTATQNMYLNVLEIIENGTVDIGAYEYNPNIDVHE